jgi:hypothetical protein
MSDINTYSPHHDDDHGTSMVFNHEGGWVHITEVRDMQQNSAAEIERLVKHTNALEDLLKSWDRLMLHEFSGSPEAMREMTEISQKTAAVVWPESGRFKLSD